MQRATLDELSACVSVGSGFRSLDRLSTPGQVIDPWTGYRPLDRLSTPGLGESANGLVQL